MYDNITTYRYGTNAFKVCESEMLNNKRYILENYNEIKTCLKNTSCSQSINND